MIGSRSVCYALPRPLPRPLLLPLLRPLPRPLLRPQGDAAYAGLSLARCFCSFSRSWHTRRGCGLQRYGVPRACGVWLTVVQGVSVASRARRSVEGPYLLLTTYYLLATTYHLLDTTNYFRRAPGGACRGALLTTY